MIKISELFFTKERADQYRKEVLKEFPGARYGTVLKVTPRKGQFWECAGARFA